VARWTRAEVDEAFAGHTRTGRTAGTTGVWNRWAVGYVIDEERGGVVAQVRNPLADPGDGPVHRASSSTLLEGAGDGPRSRGGDVRDPALRHHARGSAGTEGRGRVLIPVGSPA
jgi:hypothetical protein